MAWFRKASAQNNLLNAAIAAHKWAVAGDHYGITLPWLEDLESAIKEVSSEAGLKVPWESDRQEFVDTTITPETKEIGYGGKSDGMV